MDHRIQIAMDCQEAMALLAQALEARGMQVYRSFDLRSALAALPDCGCPHHGTAQCTCHYAVLLVYGETPPPALVVAHGRDGRTWLTVSGANNPSMALRAQIFDVLTNVLQGAPSSGD